MREILGRAQEGTFYPRWIDYETLNTVLFLQIVVGLADRSWLVVIGVDWHVGKEENFRNAIVFPERTLK